MTYISLNKIETGMTVDQVFYVADVQGRVTSNKKPYTILTVKDSTGSVEMKIWGFDASNNPDLKPKTWIKAKCVVKEYRGQPDMAMNEPPMIVPQPKDITPYTNGKGLSDEEIERHWDYLESVMELVENPFIKEYLKVAFYLSESQQEGFKTGAASATNRGAYRGGLVEHQAKVMKNSMSCLAVQLESKYRPDEIDKEVIIAASMMHDIGKIYAYQVDEMGVTTTRAGYLLQHLPMSYAISTQTWIAVESNLRRQVPDSLKDHINHCILAHHGQLDYGSPVKPMTVEAWIVHVGDMMDSMTSNYAEAAVAKAPDEDGFVPGSFFSSRPLYVGNDK